VSADDSRPFRVLLERIEPDGTTREIVAGDCSAYVLAICAEVNGELRVLTDHDGPPGQRRKAIRSLTEHIRRTIGLGR
jgi:hypothetical protein